MVVYVCTYMQSISDIMQSSMNIVGLKGRRMESIAMPLTYMNRKKRTSFDLRSYSVMVNVRVWEEFAVTLIHVGLGSDKDIDVHTVIYSVNTAPVQYSYDHLQIPDDAF